MFFVCALLRRDEREMTAESPNKRALHKRFVNSLFLMSLLVPFASLCLSTERHCVFYKGRCRCGLDRDWEQRRTSHSCHLSQSTCSHSHTAGSILAQASYSQLFTLFLFHNGVSSKVLVGCYHLSFSDIDCSSATLRRRVWPSSVKDTH